MKKILAVFFCFYVPCAASAELKEGETYRTKVVLSVSAPSGSPAQTFAIGTGSKFEVLDIADQGHYVITVNKLHTTNIPMDSSTKAATEGVRYHISKTIDSTALNKLVNESFAGVVSGPLIVPFKYRTKDKSFSGETTIGYYAGIGVDIWKTAVAVTPFLSAGLTQVSVAKQTATGVESENKSGFTWAAGLLFQNWDGMNIGLVYGEDRVGGDDWEHEGDGWWSISVGWKL